MHLFCSSQNLLSLVSHVQVQIRPWNLSDSDFVMDGSQPLDPRKTIFVGGVPRPLRAGNRLTYPQKASEWDSQHWLAWCTEAGGCNEKFSPREKAILFLGFQDAGQMDVMLRIHGVMEGSVFLFAG